jgi:hypothetical protein
MDKAVNNIKIGFVELILQIEIYLELEGIRQTGLPEEEVIAFLEYMIGSYYPEFL